MPRYRFDPGDLDDAGADLRPSHRRSRRPDPRRPDAPPPSGALPHPADEFVDPRLPLGTTPSTYADAQHGPRPRPSWVITSGDAFDVEREIVKTGKEADVSLVERVDPTSGHSVLLAAKRYRRAEHRLFHRDAGYLEGRRTRKTRDTRAIATRTRYGKALIAGQWAATEFEMLATLWSAGVAVPYPVQLRDTELLLEFIGDEDGEAAPRLAEADLSPADVPSLWDQCVEAMLAMGALGYTHGDLSPFNVLVDDGRLILIDLPQVVDLVANPQGEEFLRRDCTNIARWFAAHGIDDADATDLAAEVRAARA